MGPSGRFTHVVVILDCWDRFYAGVVFGYSSLYKGDFALFSEVASGNSTSTCIPRVDGWSTDPRVWGVTPAPYGPSNGSLSDAEMPRPFRVWTSIFKFLMKRRRKNPFLRTRQILKNASSSVPLPGEAEILAEAGSSPSPIAALPFDTHELEASATEAAHSYTPNI